MGGGQGWRGDGDGGGFVGGRVADGAGGLHLKTLRSEVGKRADALAAIRVRGWRGQLDVPIVFGDQKDASAFCSLS